MNNLYHTIHVDKIPSVNHYVKHAKGRHYIAPDVAAFKRSVMAQLAACNRKPPPDKDIALEIEFYLKKDFYKRDLDNMPKVFIDCLAKYYGFNDSQVVVLQMFKQLDKTLEKEKIVWRFNS